MKASLIFSSTSHSINVQKVGCHSISVLRLYADQIDFQNCSVQSIRPKMYNSRDRECRRTAASVQKRLNEKMEFVYKNV